MPLAHCSKLAWELTFGRVEVTVAAKKFAMDSTDTSTGNWQELVQSVHDRLKQGRRDGKLVQDLQRALPLALGFGHGDERVAWTYYMLGVCLCHQHRYVEAKRHLRLAADIYATAGKERMHGLAWAWFCTAEKGIDTAVSRYVDKAAIALDLLARGKPDALPDEDQYFVVRLLEIVGHHHAESDRHELALKTFDRLTVFSRGEVWPEDILSRFVTAITSGRLKEPLYRQLLHRLQYKIKKAFAPCPPSTRLEPVEERIFDICVTDPYRWLEEAGSERAEWISRQNAYSQGVLDREVYKGWFVSESRRLYYVNRYSNPYRRGSRIFYGLAQPKDRHEVTYAVSRLGNFPRSVIDPGKEEITITGTFASRDGAWMAYSVSSNGSDWQSWKIRDVQTGKDLDDKLDNVRARYLCWRNNNREFLYAGYANLGGERIPIIQNHKLRSPQTDDEILYRGQVGQYIQPFEHDRHVFISSYTSGAPGNEILHARKPAKGGELSFESLFPNMAANYKISGWQGWRLLFVTDHEAPRRKLISIDVNTGERFTEIEEREDVLESVFPVTDGYVAHYVADSSSKLVHIGPTGEKNVHVQHGPCTVGAVTWLGKDDLCYSVEGLSLPRSVYRLNVDQNISRLVFPLADHVDPDRYDVRQVFLRSRDGTRVDMFIAHKKGLALSADTPAWLTGYGGFRYINSPRYHYDKVLWMELGGLVACATIRGGGEYGENWHRAGCRQFRQNSFDDFIACAEYLLEHNMTSTRRLAVSGSSNGGLLMAAVLTQRPELFGAVCLGSPLSDMLRYHKFNFAHEWVEEFGCSDDENDCGYLLKYSPLHNVRSAVYPPTFIQVGAADDRVDPLHSYKFAAALQSAQQGAAPIIVKTYEKQGHTYACAPTWYGVDQLSFLAHASGLTDFLDT